MKSLKYIIVEDNRLDELALRNILSTYPLLQFECTCRTITEAQLYLKNNKPDIVFADIEMPDGTGVNFVKALHGSNPIVIFITSHPEFALESFETPALDYLLKPVSEKRFELTYRYITDYHELTMLAHMQLEQSGKEAIVFKDGFSKIRLQVNEVLYLQAMQDYTKIVTAQKAYLTNGTLSAFLNDNQHFNFIRIHRSYAVLLRQIKVLQKDKIIGQNFELPIGKTYRATIAKLRL